MRRIFLIAVAASLAAAACSGSSSSERTSPSFAGRWVLQSVNGAALPFTTSQSGTTRTELVSDVIGASSSSSFTDTMTVRTTDNGQVSTAAAPRSGVWVVEGSTVTFTFFDDGLSTSGTFDGKTFTVSASGRSYVYARQ